MVPASVVGQTAPHNAEPAVLIDTLTTADGIIWWTGLVVILTVSGFWLVRSRKDPLHRVLPRPNRLWPEHVLVLMGGFLVLAWLLQDMARRAPDPFNLPMTAGNVAQMAGALACLVLAARFFDGGVRRFILGGGHPLGHVLRGLILVPAALTLCDVVYRLTEMAIRLVAPGFEAPEHAAIDALRSGSEPVWVLWLGAVLIAPVAEEFFFRGLLQTLLGRLTGRPWVAVAATAVGFGIAHAQQPQVIPTIAVLGVLLGVSYERSGSLVAPIVLHSIFNLKTMLWETLGSAG
ncbi:MAG: CPBP family intramembrane metalloprotease [Planctomycetes bacterium]|nr:CPBP family intramembrane metalloprotease [Planctomycetota bacterium]